MVVADATVRADSLFGRLAQARYRDPVAIPLSQVRSVATLVPSTWRTVAALTAIGAALVAVSIVIVGWLTVATEAT
jgi:hypothetical protein